MASGVCMPGQLGAKLGTIHDDGWVWPGRVHVCGRASCMKATVGICMQVGGQLGAHYCTCVQYAVAAVHPASGQGMGKERMQL